tara:strand:- start:83 stop:454 length:372 start_codon:yes stop_codon:yes gene_type:complete
MIVPECRRQGMARTIKLLGCIMTTIVLILPASAGCRLDVSKYVGWTIVYDGTVTGYIDPDGSRSDDFEGCEYDRVLLVDYNKAVTCREYNYTYSYMPDIVILTRGNRAIACIDNEEMDISIGD